MRKIFTWHIHGNYLYYLSQSNNIFYLPKKETMEEGYGGKTKGFKWPENVIEVPADKVRNLDIDLVVFQSDKNLLRGQHEIFSLEQKQLPQIFLEHNPPRTDPVNQKHCAAGSPALIVHVTHFNELMWDNGSNKTAVIEHGVLDPRVSYKGDIKKGIVVINNLFERGRRLGWDIFERIRKRVPLDIIGINSEKAGGLGEVAHKDMASFMAKYRFFFSPVRYTSMGLAMCEAMVVGLPVVCLATTENVTAVHNGVNGYISADVDYLVKKMHILLLKKELALKMSKAIRAEARRRFNIKRFLRDWEGVFEKADRGD